MPAGNITTSEKVRRLSDIKKKKEEGLSDQQIADSLGMPLTTVKRNIRYLDEINVSDLSPKVIAERRSEIDIELLSAIEEARQLFLKYKDDKARQAIAKNWFYCWLGGLEARAKIYGLDNVKIEAYQQITQQHNTYLPSFELSSEQKHKIADAIVGKM